MKKIICALAILMMYQSSQAVDITLKWDTTGAANYKIRMSTDNGRRWDAERLTGGPGDTFTWVMAPEDRLLLFKAAATDGHATVYNNGAGCWYDHRLITAETFYPIIRTEGACKTTWDAVETATGYELYFSDNLGTDWQSDAILGDVLEYTWDAVPAAKLILIKGCATKDGVTGCRPHAGSWYDSRYPADHGGHVYWKYPIKTLRIH